MLLSFTPSDSLDAFLNPRKSAFYAWISTSIWPEDEGNSVRIIFPDINVNTYLHKKLTEDENYLQLFDSLDFFNLLYGRFEFILNNLSRSENILGTLERDLSLAGYNDRQILFVFFSLSHLLFRINGDPLNIDNYNDAPGKTFRKLASVNIQLYRRYNQLGKKFGIDTSAPLQNIIESANVYQEKRELRTTDPAPADRLSGENLNLNSKTGFILRFREDISNQLYEAIKDYFSAAEQQDLKNFFEDGRFNSNKFSFQANGNKLIDVFNRLFEHQLIIVSQKKDIHAWLQYHFRYYYKGSLKEFSINYVKQIMSNRTFETKCPIIEISDGKVYRSTIIQRKTGPGK
jgi:hypothetical protein